jgi:outer membrane protein assembly factor BamD
MLWSRFVIAFTLALLLGACSSDEKRDPELDTLTMVELYNQAQENIQEGNYPLAVSKLDALLSRFPFGNYAESAELNLMYANLQNESPELTIGLADRFIRLHPDHPQVDYAYYMRGLANYYSGFDLTSRFLPGDAYKRDMGATRASFDDFAKLVRQYPNSPYANDAHARMIYLRNTLAKHEIYIASYYVRRQTYVAALNRAKTVVDHYQETPSVAEGLAIMIECYYRLGLNELAENTQKILVANYPDSPYLDQAGNFIGPDIEINDEKSWLNILSFGLFR